MQIQLELTTFMLNQRKKDELMVIQKEKHIEDKDISLEAVIIVVSDSLSKKRDSWKKYDKSAKKAKEILLGRDITVQDTLVIPDEITEIQASVRQVLAKNPHLIVLIGGTGVAPRDVTIEAIFPVL